ncbi:MAG: xylulokinase [Phycisphaeraceae bacterium]|nr:xylulokinase [Phycisphaeraceae bacterium]
MAYLLGIDIGTSGTKTLICDTKGKVYATATAEHDLYSPRPGWSEQDPRQWWQATCQATKAVMKKAKVKAEQVIAVGLSGQMHGSVFLADGDKPLRPALLWNDQRTSEQCARIEAKAGGRAKLIDMVGNPALTGFTAPKILWVRQHEPKVYDKTKHILLPKDYIRYCMTGQYATEVGDASGTLLLDVRKRAWNKDVLSMLEIDSALMPRCFESHVVSGEIHAAAAAAMGLKKGTPVVGGSGDQPAGAVGNGIVASGIVSATLGTSGVVFAHADKPTYDPQGRVHTMCAAVEGKWCVFGCMLAAGGSFQWFRNHLARVELAEAKKRKVDPYELLIAEADKAPAGCEGLFFLPYLTGERCPYANPNARGGWIGLTSRHNRPMLVRSVLEGVTFGMADALQVMDGMGIAVNTVRLSGGGARSSFWRQLQADIYGKPVATINAQEGPAYGVAILAGVGAGVWKNVPQACKAVIHETEKLKPNRKLAALYAKHHAQYQRLYGALAGEFDLMAKLVAG